MKARICGLLVLIGGACTLWSGVAAHSNPSRNAELADEELQELRGGTTDPRWCWPADACSGPPANACDGTNEALCMGRALGGLCSSEPYNQYPEGCHAGFGNETCDVATLVVCVICQIQTRCYCEMNSNGNLGCANPTPSSAEICSPGFITTINCNYYECTKPIGPLGGNQCAPPPGGEVTLRGPARSTQKG